MNVELLKALGRCRVVNEVMIETAFGVSEDEVESLLEQKILSKELLEDMHPYYMLTEKGEKVLKETAPSFGEIYRGFILEHDVCLMEFYLKRTEQERESWLTRDDLIKKHRLPGTVDGAFINEDGQLEAVEVISKTAKRSVVEKTEAFLKELNIKKMNYLLY